MTTITNPITLEVTGRFSTFYFNGPISLVKGVVQVFDIDSLSKAQVQGLGRALQSGVLTADAEGSASLTTKIGSYKSTPVKLTPETKPLADTVELVKPIPMGKAAEVEVDEVVEPTPVVETEVVAEEVVEAEPVKTTKSTKSTK